MVDQPQANEPDMNAVLNSIDMNDVLQSIGPADLTPPAPGAPQPPSGAPAAPISGPDGPLPQPVAATQGQQEQQQPSALHRLATGLQVPGADTLSDAGIAAATGGARGLLEVKDFATGVPKEGDKSATRKFIESENARLKEESLLNHFASSVGQWGVAFAGFGKFAKVAGLAGRIAPSAELAAQTAVTAATALDPRDKHFSDFVQTQFPSWAQNAVTDFLATRPDDSAGVSRLKNVVENVVLNEAISRAFVLAADSIRKFRFGDIKAANAVAAQADDAFAKAVRQEPGAPLPSESADSILPSGGTHNDPVPADSVSVHTPAGEPTGGGQPKAATLGDGQALPSGEVPGGPGVRPSDGSSSGVGADGIGTDAQLSPGGGSGDIRNNAGMGPLGNEGGGVGTPSRVRAAPDNGSTGPHAALDGSQEVGAGVAPAADTEALLNNLKRDNDAIIAHGGRDGALAAGYKFKSGPDYIPWQKLNTDGAPQEFIASAIEQGSSQIAAKRGGNAEGVLTDKAVNKMVEQRAAVWNERPEDLRGALLAAGDKAPELAANMETSFLIANKAFQDTYELAQRINAGNFSGFGSEAEALAALQHRLATSVEWYANGQALVSNFGRGLRRAQGQFKFTPEQLQNIRTSDPKALAAFIEQTGGDPKLLAKAGRVSLFNQIGDVAAGYRAANLLWGWKTHVVNFVGNGLMLGWRPAESLVGSVVKQTIGTLRGDEGAIAAALSTRAQAIKEIAYTKSSLMDSFNAARAAFVEGDSILMPHSTEHTALSQVGSGNLKDIFQPMDTADGIWANTLKAGGMGMALLKGDLRLMGAADEVFKQIRYRSTVQAKAHVEADAMGLTGEKLKDFVSKKLDAAFDDTGRALDQEAFREAQFSTFQNDYVKPEDSMFGPLASSYANAAAQSPWLRATVTPFIKTPTNLFRYGVKLTPGLNLLQVEYKNALMGLKGDAEQIRAMGQMGLGIMTASIAGGLWASGNITGAGPLNPQQKAQWMAQGNREYSIAWTNAEGKREYFELSRWDPIGLPLTLVADSLNLLHHANASLSPSDMASIAAIPVIALTKMMANKTYTKSIGDALNVITDNSIETGAKAGAYWRRTVPGLLPFSTLLQTVTNDPYLREARTTLDAFMARVPGWADSHIAPRRDIYGDPILAPQGFGATEIKNPVNDALNQSFAITGNYLAPPAAKNANTGGVDLRDFTIENGRQAYDRYQELAGHPPGAPSLKDSLTKLVERPDFQKLTHGGPTEKGTQASAIMDIVKKYREAAFNQLLRESPSLKAAVNQRKLDIWRADMVGAKDPKAVAGQARMDNINNLLHPYGLNLPTVNLPPQ